MNSGGGKGLLNRRLMAEVQDKPLRTLGIAVSVSLTGQSTGFEACHA